MTKRTSIKMMLASLLLLLIFAFIGNSVAIKALKDQHYQTLSMVVDRDLERMQLYTDKLLTECQTSAYNLRGLIGYDVIQSEQTYQVLESFLRVNPHLQGVLVAFEPSQLKEYKIAVPATYVYGNNTFGYRHARLDSLYDYTKANWYAKTKEVGHVNWGTPTIALDGTLIAPFCVPLRNKYNEFMGVMCANISIASLNKKIREATPYSTVKVTVMDHDLKFIVHENQNLVMNIKLDSLLKLMDVEGAEEIYQSMREGDRGQHTYVAQNGQVIRSIFYGPIEKTHWIIALDYPERDLEHQFKMANYCIGINIAFGIIIIMLIIWIIFRNEVPTERK